jgi:hypothetical protein
MASKINMKKLEKYKDRIKTPKKKLDEHIKELMQKILVEFNQGYPTT